MSEENNVRLYYNPNGDDITIGKYNEFLRKKDKDAIADFIYNRLYSRYIKPFEFGDYMYKEMYKNGFSMMANCCLLIETLQTFKEGKKNSKKNPEKMFQNFFNENKKFSDYIKTEKVQTKDKNSFYIHVRCGILHQGETTGGWRINRKDYTDLLDENNNINANKFMYQVKNVLDQYRNDLKNANFDNDDIWQKFKVKMNAIIDNC